MISTPLTIVKVNCSQTNWNEWSPCCFFSTSHARHRTKPDPSCFETEHDTCTTFSFCTPGDYYVGIPVVVVSVLLLIGIVLLIVVLYKRAYLQSSEFCTIF